MHRRECILPIRTQAFVVGQDLVSQTCCVTGKIDGNVVRPLCMITLALSDWYTCQQALVSTFSLRYLFVQALHGDMSQFERERKLENFRRGKYSVLVATDVASRGLDIPNVDLVLHYELPTDTESFLHR